MQDAGKSCYELRIPSYESPITHHDNVLSGQDFPEFKNL